MNNLDYTTLWEVWVSRECMETFTARASLGAVEPRVRQNIRGANMPEGHIEPRVSRHIRGAEIASIHTHHCYERLDNYKSGDIILIIYFD